MRICPIIIVSPQQPPRTVQRLTLVSQTKVTAPYTQEAAKHEKVWYRVRQFPCVGPTAEEIIKVVNREQPDLLVTGAKGRNAVTRFLQGSVSMKLAQQRACSVRVVR